MCPRHVRRGVGAHEPVGGSVMDAHLLQSVEVAQQLLPFRREAGLAGEVVEKFLHRQRQEGAEDVTADGGVGGMEDRPGAHDRLGPAEEVLDLEKIAIAQHRLQRSYLRIGAQDEDPVEARLLGELARIDLDEALALSPGFAQITPIGGIADQRLVALSQLGVERGDDRFAVLAVVLGLRLVAADDIADAFDLHLLDEQRRFSRLALDEKGHERIVVLEHDPTDDGVGALARAEDVFQLALFQPGDGRRRYHAAVGDDADPADRKAPLQAIDDRQQRRHVGGGARPHFGADRPAVAVDDEAEDHLLQVRAIVLGIAVLAERLAALAIEGEAGGVHEDGGEVGEEIAAAVEQPLLDQVFDAARRQRPIRLLLHLLAEPGHGPVEVMQIEPLGAGDVVILDPRGAVAVGSGDEQPMQRGDETARSTGNSNPRSFSKSSRTAPIPSRSQILPNSIGPPIRLAAIDRRLRRPRRAH